MIVLNSARYFPFFDKDRVSVNFQQFLRLVGLPNTNQLPEMAEWIWLKGLALTPMATVLSMIKGHFPVVLSFVCSSTFAEKYGDRALFRGLDLYCVTLLLICCVPFLPKLNTSAVHRFQDKDLPH